MLDYVTRCLPSFDFLCNYFFLTITTTPISVQKYFPAPYRNARVSLSLSKQESYFIKYSIEPLSYISSIGMVQLNNSQQKQDAATDADPVSFQPSAMHASRTTQTQYITERQRGKSFSYRPRDNIRGCGVRVEGETSVRESTRLESAFAAGSGAALASYRSPSRPPPTAVQNRPPWTLDFRSPQRKHTNVLFPHLPGHKALKSITREPRVLAPSPAGQAPFNPGPFRDEEAKKRKKRATDNVPSATRSVKPLQGSRSQSQLRAPARTPVRGAHRPPTVASKLRTPSVSAAKPSKNAAEHFLKKQQNIAEVLPAIVPSTLDTPESPLEEPNERPVQTPENGLLLQRTEGSLPATLKKNLKSTVSSLASNLQPSIDMKRLFPEGLPATVCLLPAHATQLRMTIVPPENTLCARLSEADPNPSQVFTIVDNGHGYVSILSFASPDFAFSVHANGQDVTLKRREHTFAESFQLIIIDENHFGLRPKIQMNGFLEAGLDTAIGALSVVQTPSNFAEFSLVRPFPTPPTRQVEENSTIPERPKFNSARNGRLGASTDENKGNLNKDKILKLHPSPPPPRSQSKSNAPVRKPVRSVSSVLRGRAQQPISTSAPRKPSVPMFTKKNTPAALKQPPPPSSNSVADEQAAKSRAAAAARAASMLKKQKKLQAELDQQVKVPKKPVENKVDPKSPRPFPRAPQRKPAIKSVAVGNPSKKTNDVLSMSISATAKEKDKAAVEKSESRDIVNDSVATVESVLSESDHDDSKKDIAGDKEADTPQIERKLDISSNSAVSDTDAPDEVAADDANTSTNTETANNKDIPPAVAEVASTAVPVTDSLDERVKKEEDEEPKAEELPKAEGAPQPAESTEAVKQEEEIEKPAAENSSKVGNTEVPAHLEDSPHQSDTAKKQSPDREEENAYADDFEKAGEGAVAAEEDDEYDDEFEDSEEGHATNSMKMEALDSADADASAPKKKESLTHEVNILKIG